MQQDLSAKLEQRLGRVHARQRLGIEKDYEQRIFGHGINFFHIENWYSIHSVIRNSLKLAGLYWRGCKNAERIQIRHNLILWAGLPIPFNEFTILHISDMHADISQGAMRGLVELLDLLSYDLCVLTGDYRGKTFGPFDAALEGMAQVRSHLKGPVYGVLGNHDTIRMVPGLEEMGIRMLLNECETIVRANERIHLAGIDDAHYYHLLEQILDEYMVASGLQSGQPLFQSVNSLGTAVTGRALNRYNAWAAIRKRAKAAGFLTPVGCHTWRATGITIYLENDGRLEHAQQMAGHESPRTTKLYDRTKDEITLSEVERIPLWTFDPKLRWCLSFVAYARFRARGVIGADTTCPCSPRKIVLVIHTDNVLSQLALCSPGLGPPSAHGCVTKSDKSPKIANPFALHPASLHPAQDLFQLLLGKPAF